MRIIKLCVLILAGALGLACAARAQSGRAAQENSAPAADDTASWLAWHTQDFFGPCTDDCGIALYGGREVTTPMSSVFLIHHPVAPWNVQTGNAGVIAAAFSRSLATLFGLVDVEAEAGIGQRFGDMHATTAWVAADFRWSHFPWNNVVATTVAFADGPSMASQIDTEERIRSGNGHGSDFLNFASPEITLALPGHPETELVLRYQHRSGIFGVLNGVDEASSFATIGFRHLF
jgi:hypothetical protein